MPFYRLSNGMQIHMKGTKLPQPCAARIGIEGKKAVCSAISAFLCDGQVGGGKTCDRALCEAHARQIGPNRHLCHECLAQHPQRGLFTGILSEVG